MVTNDDGTHHIETVTKAPFDIIFSANTRTLVAEVRRALTNSPETSKEPVETDELSLDVLPDTAFTRAKGSSKSIMVGLFSSHSNLLYEVHRHLTPGDSGSRPERYPRPSRALRQITDSAKQKIIDGYREGMTVYELAAHHQCHRTTVSEVLKRNGVKLRRTPAPADQIQEMIRLYESGLSLARVGERFGVNASTVLKHLRERGVPTRKSHGRD